MKWKILSLLLAICVMLPLGANSASAAGATPFEDVRDSDWYANAVQYVYKEGLFNGTSTVTFSPNSPMQRVQLVQVLANRTEGYSQAAYAGVTSFVDVPVDHWGCGPIRWAYRNDLADGVGDNRFDPETALTREQLAVFLYRYAQRTGVNTSSTGNRYYMFPDRSKVSTWAVTAMKWAVNQGIINGSDGLLKPGGTATRAEVAQMFLNAAPVLTSTRLLPQEERPDPDLTPSLAERIDTQFVLKCLVNGGGSRTTYTSQMTTAGWQSLASMWLGNAYWCYHWEDVDAPTPIVQEDFISADSVKCVFTRDAMDRAIELFGGDPAEVLADIFAYEPFPGYDGDKIRPAGNYLNWTLPGREYDVVSNLKVDSLREVGGKAKLTYSFQVMQVGGWTYQYHGTATLVESDNSLGYKIESYQRELV